MNITGTTPTVFDPATKSIIDFVKPTETNEQALLRLERWGPGLIVLAYDDAIAIHENAAKTEPAEITPERWEDMLCVLPPASWRNTGAEESFKLSERKTGLITSIFVRLPLAAASPWLRNPTALAARSDLQENTEMAQLVKDTKAAETALSDGLNLKMGRRMRFWANSRAVR